MIGLNKQNGCRSGAPAPFEIMIAIITTALQVGDGGGAQPAVVVWAANKA